jgi:iron(III) transport system ATP-binding protein
MIQQGTSKEIYHSPIDAYCAGLFGEYNLLNAENAAAFFPGEKKPSLLIVRPEQFAVVNENVAAVRGVVEAVYFFGSYYCVDVMVNGQVLKVRTESNNLVIEDKIGLIPSKY